ncbi:MAG: hypothetical protein C7B43_13130 [Sulfobacillus benefaciens]|jgi:hypothetical protein|uniref:Uncharacterized protein n=1 Tax=Sulfobacillus benefaciens TaxID=453960 RepID=A0A2T2WWW0_9FIRM|nr:MAG: hypothetical protein C7B43_13130 [Sulfobacillus benefaciens]
MSWSRTLNLLSGLSVFVAGDDQEIIARLKSSLRQWGAEIITYSLPTSVALYCHRNTFPPRVTSAYPWTMSDRLAHILADEASLEHGHHWWRDTNKISVHFHNLQNEAIHSIIRGLFFWMASYDGRRLHELFNASWEHRPEELPAPQSSLGEDQDPSVSVNNPLNEQDAGKPLGDAEEGHAPTKSQAVARPVMEGPKYLRPDMNNVAAPSFSKKFTNSVTQEGLERKNQKSDGPKPTSRSQPSRRTSYKP